jgi:hypothetical protein
MSSDVPQLTQVRARHKESWSAPGDKRYKPSCTYCQRPWPCDTFQLFAAYDALARQLEVAVMDRDELRNCWHERLQISEQIERQLAEAYERAVVEFTQNHHNPIVAQLNEQLAEAQQRIEKLERDRRVQHGINKEQELALDKAKARLAMLRGHGSTHLAWLIESNDGGPFYYNGDRLWTTDAYKAIWFPSSQAAAYIIAHHKLYKYLDECDYQNPHPVEHGFDSTPMTLLDELASKNERLTEVVAALAARQEVDEHERTCADCHPEVDAYCDTHCSMFLDAKRKADAALAAAKENRQ